MLRRLSLGLLASAISVAALPPIAQDKSSADDLGVMSISLKDLVKPTPGHLSSATSGDYVASNPRDSSSLRLG